MKKIADKKPLGEAKHELRIVGLAEVVRRDLHAFVIDQGMQALDEVLEAERTKICGPRYAHVPNRAASRAGYVASELALGGRRVSIARPRARTSDDHEVELPSWSAFAGDDPLHARAVQQMLIGVSTRRYARSLEPTQAPVRVRGTSKSAASRRFVAATQAAMTAWLARPLAELHLAVLMIDGVHIDEHVLLVALGIDSQGEKHVLSVREGATENSTACTALLADLHERGLATDRSILVVLDGGKALHKAVRDVFVTRAMIQRCQVHKMRNVEDQLSDAAWPAVRAVMRQAYRCGNAEHATKLLSNLARQLHTEHPSAASSLLEGMDETLTVMRLRLPVGLERTLSTTNAIENVMGAVRGLTDRVKVWQGGAMMLRWTCAAVTDAATRFRKVRGHQGMKKLCAALQAHDQTVTEGSVDLNSNVA